MANIKRALKKFVPHFLKARDETLNEADTVQRIILFLNEVLGYDTLSRRRQRSSGCGGAQEVFHRRVSVRPDER